MQKSQMYRIVGVVKPGIGVILLLGMLGCGEKPDGPPSDLASVDSGSTGITKEPVQTVRVSPQAPAEKPPIPTQPARRTDARNGASPARQQAQEGEEMVPVLWEGYGEGPNMTGADSQMIVRFDEQEPDGEITIRVAALLQRLNGDILVGLVSEDDGTHSIIRIGDSFKGYTFITADVETGEVVLERDGEQFSVTLRRSSRQSEWPVATAATGESPSRSLPSPQIADGTDLPPPTVYEPTAAEREMGIDPNDPSTWQPGYLGPGIERAGAAEPRFEPTDDERKEGIDPNDPSTWPEGYRGPAIERALNGQ